MHVLLEFCGVCSTSFRKVGIWKTSHHDNTGQQTIELLKTTHCLKLKAFLQHVSIASYAERCISHDRFCLTVCLSIIARYHAKTTPATIMRSSLEDSPMTLVSWRLTSARNSKGNIGSERAFDWYQNHRPWMTLNDLERPKRNPVQKRCVFWSPLHKFEWR